MPATGLRIIPIAGLTLSTEPILQTLAFKKPKQSVGWRFPPGSSVSLALSGEEC